MTFIPFLLSRSLCDKHVVLVMSHIHDVCIMHHALHWKIHNAKCARVWNRQLLFRNPILKSFFPSELLLHLWLIARIFANFKRSKDESRCTKGQKLKEFRLVPSQRRNGTNSVGRVWVWQSDAPGWQKGLCPQTEYHSNEASATVDKIRLGLSLPSWIERANEHVPNSENAPN